LTPKTRVREGFGGRSGFGQEPALVVVDVSVGFTDPSSPLACEADDVVASLQNLLAEARRAQILVVYTTVVIVEADRAAGEAFLTKFPALLTLRPESRFVEIDPRVAPQPDEPVIRKLFPSAFFATPLASVLAARGCDTVIVTGLSTSGCVRATVVDAVSHGYRVVVPREAVGDRDTPAHEANLHDIELKYGDVVGVAEVISHLESLNASYAH
jgi:maleamate amidohydrolase